VLALSLVAITRLLVMIPRRPLRRGADDDRRGARAEEGNKDMNTPRVAAHQRADYRHFLRISTRWMDNDVYGHVNNVVYYSWFDTVVNEYLVRNGVLQIDAGEVIGLVVETQCRYFSELAFPQPVDAGLRVGRLGTSSVRYEIAIFAEQSATASAQGHFVHVYVDRATRRPTALPAPLRAVLERIQA
jgi:acyl-CoA thioester hydrolase